MDQHFFKLVLGWSYFPEYWKIHLHILSWDHCPRFWLNLTEYVYFNTISKTHFQQNRSRYHPPPCIQFQPCHRRSCWSIGLHVRAKICMFYNTRFILDRHRNFQLSMDGAFTCFIQVVLRAGAILGACGKLHKICHLVLDDFRAKLFK